MTFIKSPPGLLLSTSYQTFWRWSLHHCSLCHQRPVFPLRWSSASWNNNNNVYWGESIIINKLYVNKLYIYNQFLYTYNQVCKIRYYQGIEDCIWMHVLIKYGLFLAWILDYICESASTIIDNMCCKQNFFFIEK